MWQRVRNGQCRSAHALTPSRPALFRASKSDPLNFAKVTTGYESLIATANAFAEVVGAADSLLLTFSVLAAGDRFVVCANANAASPTFSLVSYNASFENVSTAEGVSGLFLVAPAPAGVASKGLLSATSVNGTYTERNAAFGETDSTQAPKSIAIGDTAVALFKSGGGFEISSGTRAGLAFSMRTKPSGFPSTGGAIQRGQRASIAQNDTFLVVAAYSNLMRLARSKNTGAVTWVEPANRPWGSGDGSLNDVFVSFVRVGARVFAYWYSPSGSRPGFSFSDDMGETAWTQAAAGLQSAMARALKVDSQTTGWANAIHTPLL